MRKSVARVQSSEFSKNADGLFRLLTTGLWTLATVVVLCTATACGFTPLHGQAYKQAQTIDLSAVTVEVSGSNITPTATTTNIPRRYSELLRAEIEDQVNPMANSQAKQFKLTIAFSELQTYLFVNPDGTASRGDLVYDTNYQITRLADAKMVANGSLRSVSSYNTSPTADYASYVSIEDARKRAMLELAQQYKLRLAGLLPTLNDPKAEAIAKTPSALSPELQPMKTHETLRPR
jgi:hypothetical protein